MANKLAPGDFTGLAQNYSKFRPGYSGDVLEMILHSVAKPVKDIEFADVGAGTGIWTRMINNRGVKSTVAIEPNDDMRQFGREDSSGTDIRWFQGTGEKTGLADKSADLLSMASSFHWVDFDRGMQEFYRVLKPGGVFVALWNPRMIQVNPLLVEIEEQLRSFVPHLKRVSSGNSGITEQLSERFLQLEGFERPMYLEGFHTVRQSIEEYLGVWWSVNDIRSQAGENKFAEFMSYVAERVKGLNFIETTYRTRAWMVHKA